MLKVSIQPEELLYERPFTREGNYLVPICSHSGGLITAAEAEAEAGGSRRI